MGNALVTKGSTITLGTGSTDIKAMVIEDFDIETGEPSEEEVSASDGTVYSFIGEESSSGVEFRVIITDDTYIEVLESIYGAGGTVAGGTEWDMRNGGDPTDAGTITITSPVTTSGKSIRYTSVNAKGLFIKPSFVLNKGYEATIKFTLDYWKAAVLST